MLVGEAAFFGQSLGREKIGVTVAGEVFDTYKPFGNQVFEIGVDQTDGDAETAGKLPLGKRLLSADLGQKLKGAG